MLWWRFLTLQGEGPRSGRVTAPPRNSAVGWCIHSDLGHSNVIEQSVLASFLRSTALAVLHPGRACILSGQVRLAKTPRSRNLARTERVERALESSGDVEIACLS